MGAPIPPSDYFASSVILAVFGSAVTAVESTTAAVSTTVESLVVVSVDVLEQADSIATAANNKIDFFITLVFYLINLVEMEGFEPSSCYSSYKPIYYKLRSNKFDQ